MINKIKDNWLLYIIVLQPIIDIMSYLLIDTSFSKISFVLRSLILFFVVLYSFFNIKNKKKFVILLLPLIIFGILHLGNAYLNGSPNIIAAIKYFIMVFQMPTIAVSLIMYLKEHPNLISSIKKGLVISYLIIIVSIILSLIIGNTSYTYEGYGITGWFSSANTQSMILVALSPIFVYYFNKDSKVWYTIGLFLAFSMLYFNGTRACLFCLIALLLVLLYLNLCNKKYYNLLITIVFILLLIVGYKNSASFLRVADVEDNAKGNAEIITEDGEVIDIEKEIPKLDSPEPIVENKKETKKEIVIKVLNSTFYKDVIKIHGEDKVYEKMKDNINLYNLSDNRMRKKINAEIMFEDASIITKLVGIDYAHIDKVHMDLENDVTAIFYYYGYIGTFVYTSYILYFAYETIKKIVKNKKNIFNFEFVLIFFTIAILIFGSEYSGAFLRKPNANIYLSFLLVLLYFKLREKKINKNKISFLLLHLGYGGIESSTINIANALSDKYEVELISFYNLKNNQVNLLNKNITVKYLYNGQPNKEVFMEYLKNKKIFSTIKEGIKAINILIKKKSLLIREIRNSSSFAIVSTRVEFSILLNKHGDNDIIKIAQEHHHHNNNKKYINILSKKYNNIDYLCALTKVLKKDYERFLTNNHHTKVILLPNMIEHNLDKSTLYNKNVISVGRLHEGKRIDELVTIFSKLKNKKCKLYIIGDGDEEEKIKQIIEQLDLQKRVFMLGYLDKMAQKKYYLDSCVFAMTSVSEGLPMVLLEAMDYGLPCIAYETETGVNDIINNKNGYVIENRDEQMYIKTLDNMLTQDLNKMSKEAILTASKYYKENVIKIWQKML